MAQKYNIGYVLSGGAARGFAHLGVLKALEEKNIKPDIISGVSAGAIVGAFYANGFSPDQILKIFSGRKVFDLMRITIPRRGIFNIDGLVTIIRDNLKAKTFSELQTPMIITMTDFEKGRVEYVNSGNLVDAVIASSSIPVLFETKEINNTPYVDGGIVDNLPVKPIEKKCKKLIGVHVNPIGSYKNNGGIAKIAERAFHLAIAHEIHLKESLFDLFIEPNKLQKTGYLDVRKGKEIFNIGYTYATQYLKNNSL